MKLSIEYFHIIYYNKMFAVLVLDLSTGDNTWFVASLTQLVSSLLRDLSETFLLGKLVSHHAHHPVH